MILFACLLLAAVSERILLGLFCLKMQKAFKYSRIEFSPGPDVKEKAEAPAPNQPISKSRLLKNKLLDFAFYYAWFAAKYDSKIPSNTLRTFMFKRVYQMDLADGVNVYNSTEIIAPWKITVGSNSILGIGCVIDGRGGLTLGRSVNIGHHAHIWTAQHDPQSESFAYVEAPVSIGDRVWISSRTTILPGVSMGEGAVLAAGAVLTKNAEPFGIYAGVPARKIGTRQKDLRYDIPKAPPFL